jgi:hypothetical protein
MAGAKARLVVALIVRAKARTYSEVQQQIPRGNDRKKGKGNSNSKYRGPSLRSG